MRLLLFFKIKLKIFVTPSAGGLRFNVRCSTADRECWCKPFKELRTICRCEQADKTSRTSRWCAWLSLRSKPVLDEKVEHGDGVVIIMLTFQFCPLNRLSKTTEQIQAMRPACSRSFWLNQISRHMLTFVVVYSRSINGSLDQLVWYGLRTTVLLY